MGTLQNEIRRLRKLKDWTQEELAQRLFVQPHTVTQWETGKRAVTLDMFENILKEMGVTMTINDVWLQLEHNMNQVKEYLPKRKEVLKRQNPTWEVENTGGNYFTLSKNLPTLKGNTVGVWIGSEGAMLRQISEEEGFATIEQYQEINDSLDEMVLFQIDAEGEFEIEDIAHELFLEETVKELIVKCASLSG